SKRGGWKGPAPTEYRWRMTLKNAGILKPTLLAIGLLSLNLAAGCVAPSLAQRPAPAPTLEQTPVFPGATWESIGNPESVGWARASLDSIRARLALTPTTGFMAVVGGRVLMSYGNVDTLSYLASVRKSILSMLYGNYVASGQIHLDKTLQQLGFDDIGGLSASEKQATIRDLIMARSGVYHAASNPGDNLDSAPPRGSQKHGTYFLYSNWDFNAAGAAFEKETGLNIYDALERDIARPIAMQDWNRAAQEKSGDSTRSVFPAYHMWLSTRDMARIGLLMLRQGNWNGRQLVPRGWVRESTSALTHVWETHPSTTRKGPFGYGYLWWVWDGDWAKGAYEGAFTGLGAVGQQITVIPKLDMVVVHKTAPGGRSMSHQAYLEILDHLIKTHRAF
ncbi:MAG TPA: serine hydrolase, partial [Gemmatimonadaceae bacterium]|nr:serine hydrolase [Gemmatimonadaceae bacterium]